MSLETSHEIKTIAEALLTVQSQIRGVAKDSINPHFKNRYASLEAVIETARPHLQEVGIVFIQAPGRMRDGAIEVSTTLLHAESGQWIRAVTEMPLAKQDPQGAGSAITYAERYSLMAMLGLPPLDDDAEAAVSRPAPTKPVAVPKQAMGAAEYVAKAKQQIASIGNERALKTWWANEKVKRDEFKLDPDKGPGSELMLAYGDKKAQFQSEMMAAG